jgi:hypothetical protein
MKTIQCPSCGAAATNFKNCEFCGSLFVRSNSVGYNPENIQNIFYFQSIANALELNLKYQENAELIDDEDITTTSIYLNKYDFLNNNEQILQCPDSLFIAYCFNYTPKRPSIAVDFAPELFSQDEYDRLKRIDEIKLFSTYKAINGENGYVMDFGNDSIGAAKIISKILIEVKGIGQGTPLFCITEPGYNRDAFLIWLNSLEDQEVKSFISKRVKNAGFFSNPAANKGSCFIATATMGSYDHPEVMELRKFRDNWILEKKWGEGFVKWYYNYGSIAAKSIEKSFVLKRICYLLIVKPLVYLSRIVNSK